MIFKIAGKVPLIAKSAFLAENATIIGDVQIGAESSIWYSSVLRGEDNSIKMSLRSSVLDQSVLSSIKGKPELIIGEDVVIGSHGDLRSCTIKNRCLIGPAVTILEGSSIGEDCIIGARSFITVGMEIPDGSLVMGIPAKVARTVTQQEREMIRESAKHYVNLSRLFLAQLKPV